MKNGERPMYGLERAETDPARILARALEPDVTTPGPPWTHTFAAPDPLVPEDFIAPPARRIRGEWIDEIYTEDEEEARGLADGEARRASRMLGLLLLAFMLVVLGVAAWTLWRATFGG